MKLWSMGLVCLCVTPAVAVAGNGSTRAPVRVSAGAQVVLLPQKVVVTQFAVPVAVPVAPRSYVRYEGASAASDDELVQRVAAEVVARLRREFRPEAASNAASAEPAIEASPSPLVARTCLKCHGSKQPQGNFRLEEPGGLAPEDRLRAIRRLLDDDPARRMPKGQVLEPDELGRILQELATIEPASDSEKVTSSSAE